MEAEAHESLMVCRDLTKWDKRSSAHHAAQTFRSITRLLSGLDSVCPAVLERTEDG